MPTITLTIDTETLAAMQRGEAFNLTGMLRAKKPKEPARLTPEQEVLFHGVRELVNLKTSGASIARIWKDIKGKLGDEHPADVLDALEICLDWCEGSDQRVYHFVADYEQWRERAQMEMFAAEDARAVWRKARGLA
jgi:hypothetical protein